VGADRILKGLNPGSPKDCGLEILSGRHLPDSWQGSMITNDFRGHRVCRYIVTPDGSGYSSREQPELIKTSHDAFRPIDVKVGPDGAIYIADWYNPIIQHGEVDFRDPRRDHTHGRIWRITAKGRPLVERPKLVDASVEELLEDLKLPEAWTRRMARLVLKERGQTAVLPSLASLVARTDASKAESEPLLLEALWTYQALDVVEPALLTRLLSAHDPRVRAAAVRVTGAWHAKLSNGLDLLTQRISDDHPQVRLETVCALRQWPSARSAALALVALDRPLDRFLDYALWQTMRELAPYWLPAAREGKFDYGKHAAAMLFALKAVGTPDVAKPLGELVHAGGLSTQDEESALALIATLGSPAELRVMLDRILAGDAAASRRQVPLLHALAEAARQRGVRPSGDLLPTVKLTESADEAVRAAALRLCGIWKLEAARPCVLETVRLSNASDALHSAAVDALAALGGQSSRDTLDQLSTNGSPAHRRMAIVALVGLDPTQGARRAVDALTQGTPDEAAALFDAVLQRTGSDAALTAALADKKLPADVAKLGLRSVGTTARKLPDLVEALNKAGDLAASGPKILSAEEMNQMVSAVVTTGDPARGEAVYRRKDLSCLKCHAIAGAGGQVGPDLSSIGGSAKVDYLVESLLQPNKAVKEGYHSTLVTTKSGKNLAGVKLRQTATELVLRNADDAEIAIPLRDIDTQAMGGSLMPDGLTDPLTRSEFADLVRFLSELGKVGPYSVGRNRVARRWQVLEAGPATTESLRANGLDGAIHDPTMIWTPAYSTVSGSLPVSEIPAVGNARLGVVRSQLEATSPGKVALRLNAPKDVRLWLDRTPVDAGHLNAIEIPSGTHTLTMAFNHVAGQDRLSVELDDVAGSAAKVRWVVGK
jgi:putative heme-binding domain-containing protein